MSKINQMLLIIKFFQLKLNLLNNKEKIYDIIV